MRIPPNRLQDKKYQLEKLNLGLTVIESGNLVKMEGQRHSSPIYEL